mmetsp:Transcript_48963/g.129432  ORF Transcript_48963/g.129432 Transcript_48963/m.129432 type:complete len:294 (+) Transcript_48963:1391-2272(+)
MVAVEHAFHRLLANHVEDILLTRAAQVRVEDALETERLLRRALVRHVQDDFCVLDAQDALAARLPLVVRPDPEKDVDEGILRGLFREVLRPRGRRGGRRQVGRGLAPQLGVLGLQHLRRRLRFQHLRRQHLRRRLRLQHLRHRLLEAGDQPVPLLLGAPLLRPRGPSKEHARQDPHRQAAPGALRLRRLLRSALGPWAMLAMGMLPLLLLQQHPHTEGGNVLQQGRQGVQGRRQAVGLRRDLLFLQSMRLCLRLGQEDGRGPRLHFRVEPRRCRRPFRRGKPALDATEAHHEH